MVVLISWNVNGVRSLPTFRRTLLGLDADIICLQETRLSLASTALARYAFLPGYTSYFSFCDTRHGYSGVATFVRDGPLTPRHASEGLQHQAQITREGRVVRTDHARFTLFNLYVPATGGDEARHNFRLTLMSALAATVGALTATGRRVILAGDFNITPTLLDTCDVVPAEDRHAWHHHPSRVALRTLLCAGPFVDVYRHLHPKARQYTCWSVQKRGRETNTGVRIDYFLVSEALIDSDLTAASILEDMHGSDHAPVSIELSHPDYVDASLTPSNPPPFCTKFLPVLQRTQSSIVNFLTPTRPTVSSQTTPEPTSRNDYENNSNADNEQEDASKKREIEILPTPKPVKRPRSTPPPNTPSLTPPPPQTPTVSQSPGVQNKRAMKPQWSRIFSATPRVPVCRHGEPCKLRKVTKTGPNRNRMFWSCRRPGGRKGDMATNCDFFEWAPYSANKPLPRSIAASLE